MERNPLCKSRHCAPDVIHFIGFAAACERELTYFPSCRLIFWLLSLPSPRGTTVLTAVLICIWVTRVRLGVGGSRRSLGPNRAAVETPILHFSPAGFCFSCMWSRRRHFCARPR